ncbi:MAG: TRAP transporter large permease subunit [Armatimonadota bacterium]|nr:TRAP transporter large permease subunit [Armatimonadota bacterium]
MLQPALLLVAMTAVFVAAALGLRWPVGFSLMLGAVAGTLLAGEGVPVRHLVEGSFGFLDITLMIGSAMIFMKVLQRNGLLETLGRQIIDGLGDRPALLLVALALFIMFPGMITGSSSACVFTTGAIAAPVLLALGIPAEQTAAIIAVGAVLGMIAPPVNIPAMIIGGGVDMPYVGFGLPLLVLTVPLAMGLVLMLGRRFVRDRAAIAPDRLPASHYARFGARLYLPLVVVGVLMFGPKVTPRLPDLGLPLIFLLGAATGLVIGLPIHPLRVAKEAVHEALPVMGILMGVGMFIQVMTLTGARGAFVVAALVLPAALLFVATAVAIPLFGAVSAFGSASVLGVPIFLALLGRNGIVVGSALSLVASLGDLMPPTALAGIFASQVVGLPGYFGTLRRCLIPAVIIDLVGIGALVWANPLARLLGL